MTVIMQMFEAVALAVEKLLSSGDGAAELFQAFLTAVGDVLRFLESSGLSREIVDAIFNFILGIFGAV